jgi:excisionase family DNA binding protein
MVRIVPADDEEYQVNRLLTTRELADYLRIPLGTIYRWRAARVGPPAYRVGRHVRFDVADVNAWLHARRDDRVHAGARGLRAR